MCTCLEFTCLKGMTSFLFYGAGGIPGLSMGEYPFSLFDLVTFSVFGVKKLN